MGVFSNLTKTGLVQSLRVIGEPASIGGNQFAAVFDESNMDVTSHVYGDADEVTTTATCLKSALSNEPRIKETLTRVDERKTYVITGVNSDASSYTITLRAKNG